MHLYVCVWVVGGACVYLCVCVVSVLPLVIVAARRGARVSRQLHDAGLRKVDALDASSQMARLARARGVYRRVYNVSQ